MSTKALSKTAPRVRDLGEFGVIQKLQDRVQARLASTRSSSGKPVPTWDLELGIGDDAAVWRPGAGCREVVTTDALVEGIHFRLRTTSWRDLGWKSLAVNVSDLAAMGAQPRCVLVALGCPGDTLLANLLELYEGMLDLTEEFHLDLIGGDIVSAPVLFLGITAIGETSGELLRRDAGRPGDALAVTGRLGASAAGLRLLESGHPVEAANERLLQAHRRPRPRVLEAQVLVQAGLRCGMDLSDGLLGDLTHICERSGVEAIVEIDRVPVDSAVSAAFGNQAFEMAISGGEDYELLCAGPLEVLERAQVLLAPLGCSLTLIGRLVQRSASEPLVQLVDSSGHPVRTARTSWDHFGG